MLDFCMREQPITSTLVSRLMHAHAVTFPAKNPPVEAIFGMVVRRPIDTFRMTATHQQHSLCPCWLRPLGLAEKQYLTHPECLVPSLAKTAGAWDMSFARDALFPLTQADSTSLMSGFNHSKAADCINP
jgi:hypothetical protein